MERQEWLRQTLWDTSCTLKAEKRGLQLQSHRGEEHLGGGAAPWETAATAVKWGRGKLPPLPRGLFSAVACFPTGQLLALRAVT